MNNTCIDAFKNVNITYAGHRLGVSPCCISPAVPVEQIDHNDPYLVKIRKAWTDGQQPSACASCHVAESHGNASRRHGSNQWYKDNGYYNTEVELIRLDYWTGDICNLACVICGPANSSQWKQELKFPVTQLHSTVNKFWSNLDLSKIKFIHFNGGEPLLSKEHIKFLAAIPNKSEVYVNYNTNGTIRPTGHLLELWSQFRLVQLDISIDDIEERFEYQRYPAKWDYLTKNLQWFITNLPSNCMFSTNTSTGILNHDNIDNLMLWLKENFHTNNYTDPIEHRTQLTQGLFSLSGASNRKEKIIAFLNDCDARRGTDWKTTFPNLNNYLETAK
jgi:sulfatase maturation enzyme AslB (radical SAM superfamily)